MNCLSLYHNMPWWTRSVVAAARGAYLNWWRYSHDSDRLVEEALERETWSSERWKAWREEQLAFVLHRAATRVPYYRDFWSRRRALGARCSWELLENWPILEKEELRSNPHAFLAEDMSPARMFHEHSSGSTGTPVNIWASRKTLNLWYALFEARWRRWSGVSRADCWAILGGQLVTPVGQSKPPFWVWNPAMRQIYMSSYHLSDHNIGSYIDALKRYRVQYIWGYTSALYSLARSVLDGNVRDVHLRVAVTNAEPLLAHERETISAAFHCPVKETYGMSEMAAAASECGRGRLHWWPEAGYIELDCEEREAAGEVAGQLICTGLCNADMPLIRYRVGDRAVLPSSVASCDCGRTLPILLRIEGRTDDVLFTKDGRAIGRLDPIFKGDLAIKEAQIIQERLDLIRLLYVPAPGFEKRDLLAMVERTRARISGVSIETQSVPSIARGPNNKFRAVINRIPPEQRRTLSELRNAPFRLTHMGAAEHDLR